MKELILTWKSGTATRTIRSDSTGLPNRRFRIGRDPAACDLALPSVTQEDLTVSKLHVEIYFDVGTDTFYLRNLKGIQNPPKLYGQIMSDAPVAIDKSGVLQLGMRELHLTVVTPQPTTPVTVAPPDYPSTPAPQPAPTKPLACPHCGAGYTYAEASQLNGRCPKDGFLLHGASIYVPPNA